MNGMNYTKLFIHQYGTKIKINNRASFSLKKNSTFSYDYLNLYLFTYWKYKMQPLS